MLDRRSFVCRIAAGVGGAFALPATVAGATTPPITYRRVSVHWTGERLVRIPDRAPRVGDFTAFAPVRGGTIAGPVDVFRVEPPAPEDDRVDDDCAYVLVPIGRFESLTASRRQIRSRARA